MTDDVAGMDSTGVYTDGGSCKDRLRRGGQ